MATQPHSLLHILWDVLDQEITLFILKNALLIQEFASLIKESIISCLQSLTQHNHCKKEYYFQYLHYLYIVIGNYSLIPLLKVKK